MMEVFEILFTLRILEEPYEITLCEIVPTPHFLAILRGIRFLIPLTSFLVACSHGLHKYFEDWLLSYI